MVRTPDNITAAELAVLEQLWNLGPVTIRQVMDVLYPRGTNSDYATVQKLLERLESKNYVTRDRQSAVHVFRATVDRDELIGRGLMAVAEKLCGGSLTPLISNLVQAKKLSAQERKSLRKLLDDLDRQNPSKGDKR